jgi:hypothetical protein
MENKMNLYNDYTLYEDGRLYSYKKNKFLKWVKESNGYFGIRLYQNGKAIPLLQHRILAQSFIPNTENKREVNHINGLKQDNRLCNLQWVTPSENLKHAYDNGLRKAAPTYKKVFDVMVGTIYDSVMEAARINNISKQYLSDMLRGRRKNKTNLQFYNN